jgi:hypothetical protein
MKMGICQFGKMEDMCDDVGPLGFHCKRCVPLVHLYVGPEVTLDNVVAEPREL